jgi:penicillin amidase
MSTTGQVGHPFADHYGDLLEPWRKGEYHPIAWNNTRSATLLPPTLLLRPAGPRSRSP